MKEKLNPLSIYVNDVEKMQIILLAEKEKRSISNLGKHLFITAAEKQGITMKVAKAKLKELGS